MRRQEVAAAAQSATNRIDNLISRVRFWGDTSDNLHQGVLDVVRGMASGEIVPPWGRAYVAGYYQAERNRLYLSELFYARVHPTTGELWTGQRLLGKDRPAAEYPGINNLESLYGRQDLAGELATWKEWADGHFWKPHRENAQRLGKPFSYGSDRTFPDLTHGDLSPLPRRGLRPAEVGAGIGPPAF